MATSSHQRSKVQGTRALHRPAPEGGLLVRIGHSEEARIPKGSAEMALAAIRTVFAQPDAAAVAEQLDLGLGEHRRGDREAGLEPFDDLVLVDQIFFQ